MNVISDDRRNLTVLFGQISQERTFEMRELLILKYNCEKNA